MTAPFSAAPCDRGIATAVSRSSGGPAHPAKTLAATILGSSLAFIDGSVVNVGLPAIGHDLGVDGATISWLVNAYLLPLGALVLFGGVAGDRWGRKRCFLAGVLVFTLASIGCACAPDFGWLLAARAVQGVGAAFVVPSSLALLGAAFSGEARGRAVGTWAAAGAVTGAIGPLVGGWLIDVVNWRAIFLVNVPIAIAATWLAWRSVDESRGDSPPPLDVAGAVLATTALALLTGGLSLLAARGANATGGDGLQLTGLALVAGVVLLAVFVALESRRGHDAMMPLALFSARGFVGVTLLTLFLYAALGGMTVLLPYALIGAGGYSATEAGAALLPLPIAMGLGSRASGHLAERYGPRPLLTAGSCIVAIGFALFLRIGPHSHDYVRDVLPALIVLAIGLTLSVAPLTTAVIGSVDAAHVGSASGVNNAVARVAGLLATALLGLVLTAGAASPAFADRFHTAALVGTTLALAAAACAFALVGRAPGGAENST